MGYPHRNIRFTTTEDGVDIAFWEIGDGKPVIILNTFSHSHVELEWTVPSLADFYMEMARRYRVIRFDPRGVGLSGEPPGGWEALSSSGDHPGMSTHGMGLDITAVAAALGIDGFALLSISVQGPVAIEYAAKHPEVTELILCEAMATVATSWLAPLLQALIAIGEIEADTGSHSLPTLWETWVPPDETDQLVNLNRSTQSRVPAGASFPMHWDAEPFLAEVSVPTLILATRTDLVDMIPDARRVAAGITDSRLQVLDGGTLAPYWVDRTAVLEAIDALLLGQTQSGPVQAGFRTVVFTDIVESTQFVARVGDEEGRAAIRELEQSVAGLAADHEGRVVKNLGDGSLVSFGSNSSAIAFALAVQNKPTSGGLQVRIGMAAGEPIQEDGDIHGVVVTQASRISDLGDAGDVIVSDSVRQLAAGKGFSFESRGEVSLKGFDEPERVWKVTQATHS